MYTISKKGPSGPKDKVVIIGASGIEFRAARVYVWPSLTELHMQHEFKLVIHSHIRGIGQIARTWADMHELPSMSYFKDHDQDGENADEVRLLRMFQDNDPDCVIMYPGAEHIAKYARNDALLINVNW